MIHLVFLNPVHPLILHLLHGRYNLLFKFLLALRRAQMGLQQSWAHLMQFRSRAVELRAIWELRTHMGFLVDNLQYYVQVLLGAFVIGMS